MEEISVAAKQIFTIGGLAVTNTFFWTLIITVALIVSLTAVFFKAENSAVGNSEFF